MSRGEDAFPGDCALPHLLLFPICACHNMRSVLPTPGDAHRPSSLVHYSPNERGCQYIVNCLLSCAPTNRQLYGRPDKPFFRTAHWCEFWSYGSRQGTRCEPCMRSLVSLALEYQGVSPQNATGHYARKTGPFSLSRTSDLDRWPLSNGPLSRPGPTPRADRGAGDTPSPGSAAGSADAEAAL